MCKRLLVLVLVAMLSPAVLGSIMVADDFDNGDIGTNPNGIGTGFNAATFSAGWTDPPVSAYVTESGTTVSLINEQLGWSRAMIASNEGAALGTVAGGYLFHGVSFSRNANAWDWGGGGGGTDRLALGVQDDGIAYNFDDGMKTGFWIQIESDGLVTGINSGWNGISTLFYNSSTDIKTQLASWSFDTLNWDDWSDQLAWNFDPVLEIYLALGSEGYSLTIFGDTITMLSGKLADTYANAGIVNELTTGYAFAFEQTEYPSMTTSIDGIVITGIPEPATMLLLGLGSLALLRRRK